MTSALAFASALAVARRAPQHGPIAVALGASLLYAGAVRLDAWYAPQDPSPTAALILMGCVALLSGWAYLKAWGWDPRAALFLLALIAILVAGGLVWPEHNWAIATWGPILASVLIGAVALIRWKFVNDAAEVKYWRDRGAGDGMAHLHILPLKPWGITQRIALVLLAADVAGLLFATWPGVVEWQGRAAAIAVTVLQITWLIEQRKTI